MCVYIYLYIYVILIYTYISLNPAFATTQMDLEGFMLSKISQTD